MTNSQAAPTRLLLVIHNHQPVGNFDFVFEDATDKAYAPLVDLLAEHPRVRVGLHFTGPLLEWLEGHRPALLSTVREMCGRGQVEILGGGWSEPMLAVLPDRDAVGQLRLMRAECARVFGETPRGMWLAERVWDPDLPRLLKAAEVEYTLLDDTHFRHAGLLDPRLTGHYVTEKAGDAVAIFPIDRELRYAIPFRKAEEAIAAVRSAGAGQTVTYGDDGEKFGVWPETHQWVWGQGWLEEFFKRLEDPEEGVELILPSEQLDRYSPKGRVYLPTASYHEMGEWTLGPEAGRAYLDLKSRLADQGLSEAAEPFLHGGIWMGFLAKYPESNILHKRMLAASSKVAEAARERPTGDPTVSRARRALYRGQCNCPYWHGLFGGLYLPHLRHAVYRQLVEAEALLDNDLECARLTIDDLDGDLCDEVALETQGAAVWISPAQGGQLTALDDRRRQVSLAHVLTRRPETYHQALLDKAGADDSAQDGPKSIHDVHRSKVPDLEARLKYDAHDRRLLVDHLLPEGSSLQAVAAGEAVAVLADLTSLRYEIADSGAEGDGSWVELQARVALDATLGGGTLRLLKRISLVAPATLEVDWELQLEGVGDSEPVLGLLAVESSLALVPGDESFAVTLLEPAPPEGEERRRSPQEIGRWELPEGVSRLSAGSSLGGATVEMTAEPPASVEWAPQETVSQSEDGAELVYQGTVFVMAWPVALSVEEPQRYSLTFQLR